MPSAKQHKPYRPMSPSPNPLVVLAIIYGTIIPIINASKYFFISGDIKSKIPWIIIPLITVISYMYVV